jgi:uncharacterized membrane protein YqjE
MKAPQEALQAYKATLAAIVLLSLSGSLAVALAPADRLDQVLAALAFIGMGVTGLIGVIGTFRPKGRDYEEYDE